MGVSDYNMGDAEETECPECGRTAAKVVDMGSQSTTTFIHCYRCGYEDEQTTEYEQDDYDDEED